MSTFQVKTETLAVRCEICHQADLFEPATGVCARCSDVIPSPASNQIVPPDRYPVQYFRYTGPEDLSRAQMLKEILLSGFTASLPGFVVLYFLALIGREGAGFLSLFFLFYLNSFFPCCFTAYRSLKKLRKTRAFRPLKEFSESVAKGACLSTLASAAVSGVLYVIYQLVVADFTLAGLFGSAFLGALCPVFYLLIFNMLGGHIVFRIQRVLEKNNTETHWGWNTDYFPPPAETPSSH